MSEDKHSVLRDEMAPDPGVDHDPALGDADDPAEDRSGPAQLDGGLPLPMSEISGEEPDPSTVNQLPVTGSVNWQPPTEAIDGYDDPRERASQLPPDDIRNGR